MKKLLPKTSKNPQGFTLIELMVAIAIVAILSAIGMVAFSSVQKNGRDTRRRAELIAIASAIEGAKNLDTGKYVFTAAALLGEFPGNTKAQGGLDPSSYAYCVATSDTVNPPTATTTTWTSATCPSGSGYAGISGGITAINYWTVCATLEGSSTNFCVSSRTK